MSLNFLFVFAGAMLINSCVFAEFPDQFYSNGKEIGGWNVEDTQKTTMWFSLEPGDKISYRQSLVIVYDDEPKWAYYVDLDTWEFVGRYSYEQHKYSTLPEDERKENRDDIPEDAFPDPGEKPTVNQLLSKSLNMNILADPPPTRLFPQLHSSSWETAYLTVNRRLVRAQLNFDGNVGSYSFQDQGEQVIGDLRNITYLNGQDECFIISGEWFLNEQNGYFRFVIRGENVNRFEGEWGRRGQIQGIWNGSRKRDD